jgi:1-acyl-sn-glycerol-3-phosphate acyltransferase
MNKAYRAYRVLYFFVNLFRVVYRIQPVGRENIPEGRAVVCATHSSWMDPFFLMLAAGKEHHLHIMAKAELFKVPVLGYVMRRIGSYSVDRGNNDVAAIRTSLRYLKDDQKIAMFPEGTRVTSDEATAAKNGAVRLAARANAPVVPVYIPRKKWLFSRQRIVIGKPYFINPEHIKLSSETYTEIANDMLQKIIALKNQGAED